MARRDPVLFGLAVAATALALSVVVFGAFVRLTDAGLGCPDWPGCYGRIDVPRTSDAIARAEAAHPERPVEVAKAWIEMGHRYAATLLGVLIIAIAARAWWRRAQGVAVALPLGLLALVVFQGLLGMWTVTLLLKPAVVTAHLVGGLATLSLLLLLALRHAPSWPPMRPRAGTRRLGWLALAVLGVQILLGGWTSTNYAALACTDFPTCQQQWWPEVDFAEGFRPWHGLGIDYEHGILDSAARTAIHMAHRLWAVVAAVAVGLFALACMRAGQPRALRANGGVILALLAVQLALGIGNVVFHLPLWMATAHNGGAALLLLALVTALDGMRRGAEAPGRPAHSARAGSLVAAPTPR